MAQYEQLREYVFSVEAIDTHSHVPSRERSRRQDSDVLSEYLDGYFSSDLLSAGLLEPDLVYVQDVTKPLMDRWRKVEPFWLAARNTAYGRCLDICARDLYGIEGGISRRNIAELDARFKAARSAGGWYQKVYKEMSRIRIAIQDGWDDYDPEFFRPARRLDQVVCAGQGSLSLSGVAKRAGMKAIHTLDDMEEAIERIIDKDMSSGAVCLKSALAYQRSVRFDKTTRAAAEEEFTHLFEGSPMCTGVYIGRGHLENYLFHCVCREADRRGLTFQIHTGLQAGNGNMIYHAEPSQLSNLFMEYRNIKFDIFHIGYPYEHVLSALAKNFANVYIDFAWAHVISPTASVNALVEYLDAVPANKINGFGDDYCFIDGVYGHQFLARENITRALAIKIDQGTMDLDRAKEIAHMMLWDNPVRVFGLEKIVGKKQTPAKSKRTR